MIRLLKKNWTDTKDFESIYWLTGISREKSDTRHHIVTVHIDTGVASKTDGSRLASVCLEGDYVNGDYEVAKRTKGELILAPVECKDWPDIEIVLDDCPIPGNGYEWTFNLMYSDTYPGHSTTNFFMSLCESDLESKPAIDSFYIQHAVEGFQDRVAFVSATDENSPVFIVDENIDRVIAIMPYRR